MREFRAQCMDTLRLIRDLVLMPDLVTTLVGAGVLALATCACTWFFVGRVRVKRLRRSSDEDFDPFYELLRASVDEDEIEPKAEMARYLDDSVNHTAGPSNRYEDYFAVAKKGRRVCGLINATMYRERRTGFINYIAVAQDEDGRRVGSGPLLRALARRMKKIGCTSVMYEIDVLSPDVSRQENDARRVRGHKFAAVARQLGKQSFEMPIDYVQPKLSLLDGHPYQEIPLTLMFVPLTPHSGVMSKQELTGLLEVVILEWYLDIYDNEDNLREEYGDYLSTLYGKLTKGLPDRVILKLVNRKWSPPMRRTPIVPRKAQRRGLSPVRRRKDARTRGVRTRPGSIEP